MFIKFKLNKPYKHIIRGEMKMKSQKGSSIIRFVIIMIPVILIAGVVIFVAVDSGVFLSNTKDTVEFVENGNLSANEIIVNRK